MLAMELDNPTSFSISSLLGLAAGSNVGDGLPKNVSPLRSTSSQRAGETPTKNAAESAPRDRERQRSPRSSKSSYKKRYRATFDKAQIYQMERMFLMNHYPDVAARSELSKNTGLMESQVQIWFQNRRAKWRKQQRKRRHDVPAILGLGYPSHLSRLYPGCEPWGAFPYEFYNTDFWTCAQQQVAAINALWSTTPPTKTVKEEFSCTVPLPESGNSLVADSEEKNKVSETTSRNVEIRDDSSLQSLRLKAKEHLATMEGETKQNQ